MAKKELKRFDMNRRPNKPKWYLRLVEMVAAPVYMLFCNGRVKVDKEVRKMKGPYLVLSSHASFMDFAQIATGLMPKTSGFVISVEEFRKGDWLMYGVGGIPKRKFTHDIVTAKNMLWYLKKQKFSCTLYPEARFSIAGVNERLDGALGKICKHAKVPVVLFKAYGNFINSPQWSKHPYRGIRQQAYITKLFDAEELEKMTADEVQSKIEKVFERDEYKWQVENNLHIRCKKRADGLHKLLYKCPHCGVEFKMKSEGISLWCEECGAKWEMDTLSRLHGVNTDKGFSHIPDWYKWERMEVRKEVVAGTYRFEDEVRVEDFYNSKTSCIPVGEAHCTHDENGFTFTGTVDGAEFKLNKPLSSMYSVHIEYNFLGRGDAFDIATEKTSYFMFFKTAQNYLTKLHLAQEELYDYHIRGKFLVEE